MNAFRAERLRLARQFRGLSLAELGDRVGVTRQYLHRLETNTHESFPTRDLCGALAAALGVPEAFFELESRSSIADVDFHFRKRRTTTVATRDNAIAYGRLFADLVHALDSRLRLPRIDVPHHSARSRPEIELAAESCRDHWKLGVNTPVQNMSRLVERAGVVVTAFPGVNEKVDAFSWFGRRPIIARSDFKCSTSRARFDIAHELGHLVLHVGMETGDAEHEGEADAFASALLLPRAAFVQEFPPGGRCNWSALFRLKQRWMVSLACIVRRAYDLRLIDAAEYRRGFIFIRKKGWSVNEPYEPPVERPELVVSAIQRLANVRHDGVGALLQRLGWTEDLLENVSGVRVDASTIGDDNVRYIRR